MRSNFKKRQRLAQVLAAYGRTGICGLIFFLSVISSAWGQSEIFKDGFEVDLTPIIQRVVIAPAAALLTRPGESVSLRGLVEGDKGAPVAASVTWESNNPDVVTVTEDGTITAVAALGSAVITASSPDALPARVLVVVAPPVPEAHLVADEQVLTEPVPLDGQREFELGYQVQVVLSGLESEPQIGDILLGTGETPLAGRVVSVSENGTVLTVILEIVGLNELFTELLVDQVLPLDQEFVDVPRQLDTVFDSYRRRDGTVVLTPRSAFGKNDFSKAAQGTSITQFLECEASPTSLVQLLTINTNGDVLFTPGISVDLGYDSSAGGLQRLALVGAPTAVFELRPRTTAAFEGKISCKFQVGEVTIPVGGPLSLFFGGQVPLGVGAEISGKVSTTTEMGYDLAVSGSANFIAGVSCQPDCEILADLNTSLDGAAHPVEPEVDEVLGSFQLDLAGLAFAYAELDIGNPFLESLRFTAFGIQAGVQQSVALRSLTAQANDPGFASDFKLELVGSAGPSNDIQKLFALFNLVPPNLNFFEISNLLARSPQGTLVITDPDGVSSDGSLPSVVAGDNSNLGEKATFTITLNPTTYLGTYNVDEVLIYRRPLGGTELVPNRPLCNTLAASSGQTVFTCQAEFLQEHLGTQTFFAYVKASLFGVTVPIPLEIAANSEAALEVVSAKAFTLEYARLDLEADAVVSEGQTGDRDNDNPEYDETTSVLPVSLGGSETALAKVEGSVSIDGSPPLAYKASADSLASGSLSITRTSSGNEMLFIGNLSGSSRTRAESECGMDGDGDDTVCTTPHADSDVENDIRVEFRVPDTLAQASFELTASADIFLENSCGRATSRVCLQSPSGECLSDSGLLDPGLYRLSLSVRTRTDDQCSPLTSSAAATLRVFVN